MTRVYEKRYRLSESDDVLDKLDKILRDIDQRMDAVETVKEAFQAGNRLDVDALLKKISDDLAEKSAAMQELLDETEGGFTPDRIHETAEKRFTSDVEQQAHTDAIAAANSRIDARATSASLGAHTSRNDNPHGVTAAQVGTLTTSQIDEDLEILEASIRGGATPAADTLGKVEGLLGKRLKVDGTQAFTLAEKGRALANIGASRVGPGFHDEIINGNFDIWQRGVSQGAAVSNYGSDDRWANTAVGSSKVHSRQEFPASHNYVPGAPRFYSRTVVTSVPGAASYCTKQQAIEGVARLAGELVTLTFWAKTDAPKNIGIEFRQRFGSGGAPSAIVDSIGSQLFALTTAWQRCSALVSLPSIAGKILGTNGDDSLSFAFWFDCGSNFTSRSGGLGQQSGTFDIARVSLVKGDATAEYDPAPARPPGIELELSKRFFRKTYSRGVYPGAADAAGTLTAVAVASGSSFNARTSAGIDWMFGSDMRAAPTCLIYSPYSGAVGYAGVASGNIDIAASTAAVSTSGASARPTVSVTDGERYIYHMTADAEL